MGASYAKVRDPLDGLSNVKANKELVHTVQLELRRLRGLVTVTLLWVPGHADIPGNETADILAKRGAKGVTSDRPIKANSFPDLPPPPPPERKRPRDPPLQTPQLVLPTRRRSMRTRKDCKQLVRGVDFSMAHASKQKKPDSKLLDPPVKCPHGSVYDYSDLNSMIDLPSAGLRCTPCRIAARNQITLPADQELWINVDDDAYAPDFDGNFASLYDRYCEPGTGSNFSYFMEYDANLLDLDDLVQRDKCDDV